MTSLLAGGLVIALGLWLGLYPKSALNFKVKWSKMLGAKLTVTKKTVTYTKYFGLILVVIGALIILS